MKEGDVLKEFLVEYSKLGHRLFRINSGRGWVGKVINRTPNSITLMNPRVFHGAQKGTPDLIGWTRVLVTQDMVGKEIAIFTGIEVKTKTGKATAEQTNFVKLITFSGGIAGVCKSLKDILMLHSLFKGAERETENTIRQSKQAKEHLI